MELIDFIVGGAVVLFFVIFSLDMFVKETFDSPGIPAAMAGCLTCMAGVYFLAGGNPWITGSCAFLALGYTITSVALKGSK